MSNQSINSAPGEAEENALHLISIESNSSSTPARGLLANTGGTETTREALITLNSPPLEAFDLPFPLSFLSFFDFLDGVALDGPGAAACFRFLD